MREDECILSISVLTLLPAGDPGPDPAPRAGDFCHLGREQPWSRAPKSCCSPGDLSCSLKHSQEDLSGRLGVGSPGAVSREKLLRMIHPA